MLGDYYYIIIRILPRHCFSSTTLMSLRFGERLRGRVERGVMEGEARKGRRGGGGERGGGEEQRGNDKNEYLVKNVLAPQFTLFADHRLLVTLNIWEPLNTKCFNGLRPGTGGYLFTSSPRKKNNNSELRGGGGGGETERYKDREGG